ncbi:MAG: DNA repair protein RadC [bacterium]|nr:DNA repair protein RadC [bacterium]MCM1376597.1 DNA repair protein RadC [Muribaculum sp.]
MDLLKKVKQGNLPYERFLRFGPENLTESELLAIILRTGTRDKSALELAEEVLALADPSREGLLGLYDISLERLQELKGIGEVKAVKLKCITELSRRIASAKAREQICMQKPETVAAYYMEQLRHRRTECVVLASVDAKGHLLGDAVMTNGSATMSLISPREIFMEALKRQAVSIILIHNHPSGDPTPSRTDAELTGQIVAMGQMLGIPLLDHIIIGDNRYMSFREKELIQ